jgi:hypothetical protein
MSESEFEPLIHYTFNSESGLHEKVFVDKKVLSSMRQEGKFIKGPIQFLWMSRANILPGKAGPVGLALWFLNGMQKGQPFKLTGEIELIAGCKRKATYAALKQLEENNLITIQRRNGARPIVSIILVSRSKPQ